MKLIVSIVDDRDVDKVLAELTNQRFGVTRVSSTGGLFTPGNSTLLIGVNEEHVPQVMKLIADLAAPHQAIVPYASYAHVSGIPLADLTEIQVGGFMSFVLNIDHFEQV